MGFSGALSSVLIAGSKAFSGVLFIARSPMGGGGLGFTSGSFGSGGFGSTFGSGGGAGWSGVGCGLGLSVVRRAGRCEPSIFGTSRFFGLGFAARELSVE